MQRIWHRSKQSRRAWVRGLLVAAAAGILIGCWRLADYAGIRPLPSGAEVRREVLSAWSRTSGYTAQVSLRQSVTDGLMSETSGSQVVRRDGSINWGQSHMAGFQSLGRLDGSRWRVSYPDQALQVTYDVKDLRETPFGQWALTGAPTIGDLVRVVETASEIRPRDWRITANGRYLIVDLVPQPPPALQGNEPAALRSLYQCFFSDPWELHIERSTGLPTHLLIGPPKKRTAGVMFSMLQRLPTTPELQPADDPSWRHERYECSLVASPGYFELRDRVQGRVSGARDGMMRGRMAPEMIKRWKERSKAQRASTGPQ